MSTATGSIVAARVAPAASRPSPRARAPTAARAVPARRSARLSANLATPSSRRSRSARPRATSSDVAERASSSARAGPSFPDADAANPADHLDSIDDDRLFSSVDADDGFTREPASMGGAIALVAGTTVVGDTRLSC